MTEEEKSQAARLLSKLGASKGGKARAEKLSPEKRKEIARKAPKARWD
jgi:ABC-type phosphate/phosphonate transport system ATPase subunit